MGTQVALLERYSLYTQGQDSKQFLSAVYDLTSSGILFTNKEEDACSFVTIDKAVEVAKALNSLHDLDVQVFVTADGN